MVMMCTGNSILFLLVLYILYLDDVGYNYYNDNNGARLILLTVPVQGVIVGRALVSMLLVTEGSQLVIHVNGQFAKA